MTQRRPTWRGAGATVLEQQRRPARGVRRRCAAAACRLVVVAAITGGCARPTDVDSVRIAVNPWPGYAFLHLADRAGHFAAEGVQVDLVEMASLADARRTYEQGFCDGFTGTLVEAVLALAVGGRPVEIALIADVSEGADVLLARPEIESLAALRGKRIGVEPNALDSVAVLFALEEAGMSLADVQLIAVPQAEMAERLRAGTVDAVQCYPPASLALQREFELKALFDSSRNGGKIIDVIGFDPDFIARRPHLVEGVVAAYGRAIEDFRRDPQAAIAVMAEAVGVAPEEFARSLEGIRIYGPQDQARGELDEQFDAALEATERALRELGMLNDRTPKEPLGGAEPATDGGS